MDLRLMSPPCSPSKEPAPGRCCARPRNGWWVITEVSDDEAMATQRHALVLLWCAMGAALVVLAAGLLFTLKRGRPAPLHELTQAITRIAQGDLTHPFHSTRRDEVGDLIHEVEGMRQRYVDMLRQVNVAAHSIASASSQIAQGNVDLSERTENTAQSLARSARASKKSPTACASLPMQHARPTSCPRVRWKWPRAAGRWSATW